MRLLVLALTMVASTAMAAGPEVQVTVGGFPDLDACMSQGAVAGLDPNGDNFLAVRSGPDTSFAKIDELHTGDVVNICAARNDFLGVVYGSEDCGVGTPIDPSRPYDGPCSSGWVWHEYIEITAG